MPSALKQGSHDFFQSICIAGFDGFNQMYDAEDSDLCPRSMTKWCQVQMPIEIDVVNGVLQPELLMNQCMPFDPTAMSMVSLEDHGVIRRP